MKNYRYVLFDLDGTLTESGEGIINSAIYALKKNMPASVHSFFLLIRSV